MIFHAGEVVCYASVVAGETVLRTAEVVQYLPPAFVGDNDAGYELCHIDANMTFYRHHEYVSQWRVPQQINELLDI